MSDRTPNYVTREGAKRLQEELARLRTKDRPKIVQEVAEAAAQGDRSENAEYIYGKRKLREIDRRMHWLTKRLEAATVVEPRTDGIDKVFFGAFVELEDEDASWGRTRSTWTGVTSRGARRSADRCSASARRIACSCAARAARSSSPS
jgi:transcription elongation GreA/GreB family factor